MLDILLSTPVVGILLMRSLWHTYKGFLLCICMCVCVEYCVGCGSLNLLLCCIDYLF